MASKITMALRNKGYNAFIKAGTYSYLIDPEITTSGLKDSKDVEISLKYYNSNVPIINQWIEKIRKKTSIKIALEEVPQYAPIRKLDIDVPSYDVVMSTKSSGFSPYRDWPYFNELKNKLTENGISWIDLYEKNIRNFLCLNYVKKSKVFLGIESGVSHYVAEVAKDKGLIIQSGYSFSEYWNTYKYKILSREIPCSRCFLTDNCKFEHRCMTEISVEDVFNELLIFIKKQPE